MVFVATTLPILAADGNFRNVTSEVGLPPLDAARELVADLDADGWGDLVVRINSRTPAAPQVFLWRADEAASLRGRFVRLTRTGLPALAARDVLTFADLDNDGRADAVVARYLDYLQPDFVPPTAEPARTAWLRGNGDGTFGPPQVFDEALAATTAAIAIGDVNADGLPDVWLGNWYEKYGSGYAAFANDLLLQYATDAGVPAFARWSVPGESLPHETTTDPAGRPTYGVAIARLDNGPLPYLLELNYGRRWNRLYALSRRIPAGEFASPPAFRREETLRSLRGSDVAPAAGFDGDAIRHGRHPKWIEERAKDDPRFKRDDEPPFRANGNTFDAAVGDIDNDGDFDVFVSTIIHGWAGDSSDRSRFLVSRLREVGRLIFESPARLSVDRIPEEITPENRNFNQGDIFCELADLDNDGRMDLILCSSDYSDPPPHDERLRVYLQQPDGTFEDRSAALGLDHLGAGQPALLDFDRDGALDLIVGQTFNRLDAARRREAGIANGSLAVAEPGHEKAVPRLRVYHNALADGRAGLVLRLRGDPAHGVARDAFGAIVRAAVDLDNDPSTPDVWLHRQLIGPGGHAGKRSDSVVHFGLGAADGVTSLQIVWPDAAQTVTHLGALAAGTWIIDLSTGANPQPASTVREQSVFTDH